VTVVRAGAQFAIPVVTFAVGLGAGELRTATLRRQRRLLGRALLATLLVVPVLTVLLAKVLPIPPDVRAGLMTAGVAVGPVAALRPAGKAGKGESDAAYALALNLTLLLASLLYVPLAVKAIDLAFHRDLQVSMPAVLRPVILAELVPLLAGLAVAWLVPRSAARLAAPAAIAGNVLLACVALLVLALLWRGVLRIGGAGLLATGAAAAAAISVGHALGGPRPGTRVVLAAFSAMKFPAMALVIATAAQQGRRALPVVLAYLLTSGAAVFLYGVLRRVVSGARTARPAPAGA
jgi:BASS family bile acid:Na+ symporter